MERTLTFNIEGDTPLVIANGAAADPLNPKVQAYQATVKKGGSKKTTEAHEQAARLKLRMLHYHDEEIGPYFPAKNFFSFLLESSVVCGKLLAKTNLARGCRPGTGKYPIEYEGPRELDKLVIDPRFRYRFMIGMKQGTRVPETMPIFDDWSISNVSVSFDDEVLDPDGIRMAFEKGGKFQGIGTCRKWGFGRFVAHEVAA